jgi:hypothetical protein
MNEKTTNPKSGKPVGEMRPEYDFSGAVRGKYYKRYHQSSNIVVLEPDVAAHFKNASAVNKALRSLFAGARTGRGLTKRSTRTRTKAARAG